jgi:hypothetical protein
MTPKLRESISAFVVLSMLALVSRAAYAQGSFFTSLSGTVVDASGAVIPGANVKIKNNGTGEEFNTVTGSDGGFTIPSLPGGIYSVNVSLMGFKTAVLNSVTLNAAIPASVKVTLEVGGLQERLPVGFSQSFTQPGGPGNGTPLNNPVAGSSPDSFRLLSLLGDNPSRIIQFVWRIRW